MVDEQITLQLQHEGRSGNFDLDFQEWDGSTIEIKFTDRLYDNSGTIRFNGKTSNAIVTSHTPSIQVASPNRELTINTSVSF